MRPLILLLFAVAFGLAAVLGAPYVPHPGNVILGVLLWIAVGLCVVFAILDVLFPSWQSRLRRTP